MVLERHRVNDVNSGSASRLLAEEQTIDNLVGVFENMNNDFGVRKAAETIDWVLHAPIS